MFDVVKLILISILLLLGSKSIGEWMNRKWEIPFSGIIGIGYLTNIVIFFVVSLPVMLFKLPTFALMVAGFLFLGINGYACFLSVKEKTLLKFHKVDYYTIACALFLLVIYAFGLGFGNIETYDSYFYSALTNNAANSKAISVVDPYTGLSNLQNFYKYMSYYYMPSFFAVLFSIKHAYLVLIWSFTFMNFVLICQCAFGACRISKNRYVNHILSIFYLSIILSVFRAPFNALHLTTFVISIYVFRFSFHLFKGKQQSLIYLIICILSSVAFTSTSLFTLLPFVLIILLTNSLIKERINYKDIYIIALPVLFLGTLYVYESLKSPLIALGILSFFVGIYFLFKFKWFHTFVRYLSYFIGIMVIVVFVFSKQLGIEEFTKNYFMQSTAISEDESVEVSDVETCLGNNSVLVEDNDSGYNYIEDQGSAIQYITNGGDLLITTVMITLTHSIPKYGGLLFLFVFGFAYRRNKYPFISYVVYLMLFNNPLVLEGLDFVTLGLSARIHLFFNTYFALLGIKYFFEYMIELSKRRKWEKPLIQIIKGIGYGLGTTLIVSIISFAYNIMPTINREYNLLYKMPNKLIKLEDAIESLNLKGNKNNKPRYFFTQSAFNVTMIDSDGENKVTIMNSKEYMNYFHNHLLVSDKTMINDYFESEGTYDFNNIAKVCNINTFEYPANCSCTIENMFKLYSIDYVVTKKPKNEAFAKQLEVEFNIVYKNNDYIILEEK